MKERPILFNCAMVQAILAGRKTQTRRAVKGLVDCPEVQAAMVSSDTAIFGALAKSGEGDALECPFGKPGDRLWVRETHYIACVGQYECGVGYKADHPTGKLADGDGGYNFRGFSNDPEQAGEQWNWAQQHQGTEKWRPAIHMPRWASRTTLEIVSVRVERLNEISNADAKAEGIEYNTHGNYWVGEMSSCASFSAVGSFKRLWESVYGPGSFDDRWVWVVEFKRL